MAMLILLSLILLSIIHLVSSGLVRPYGAQSIILSSTNAGEVADYNFTMTLDTDLPASGHIEISFPVNQYVPGLGLPHNIEVYAPYPNLVTATLDSATAKTLICSVGARKANTPFTIEVRNINNPLKVGGTGNFKVVSKVGAKVLDVNFAFGSIGIFPSAETLLSASVGFASGSSDKAGDYSNYEFRFVPSLQLPTLIDVKIEFPVIYNLSHIQSYDCGGYTSTMALQLYCQLVPSMKNVIIFNGFSNSPAIGKGVEVVLTLANVINPPREMATETFKYYVREVGTNNTIQKHEGVSGLYINPGLIHGVVLENRYPAYPLYTNIQREILLKFRPSNPCNYIKIATSFPIISSCRVIGGLSQIDEFTSITCTPSSHVILISMFKTYEPEDIYLKVIQVTMMATLPSQAIKTNMVEIYTFLDPGFEEQVDENTVSADSQVQIISLTTTSTHANSGLTTDNTDLGASNIFTFRIIPSTTHYIDSITVEFGPDFVGLPSCSWKLHNSATWIPKTCTLSDGVLSMDISDTITNNAAVVAGTQTPPSIRISGITNPVLPGTYTFRYYLVALGDITERGSATFTMTLTTIPGMTLLPLATTSSAKMPVYFNLISPIFLPDGFFSPDEPTKLTGRIDIGFRIVSTTDSWFPNDLGTGLETGTFPCDTFGLLPSVFTSTNRPQCEMIKGPIFATDTDYVTVRVKDFNPILAGSSVDVNFPVVHCQTPLSTCEARVQLYIQKEYIDHLVAERTVTFTSTTASYGTAMTASFITLANTSVQATTDLSITFLNTISVGAGSNNSIQIEYPSGFVIDPTIANITLDGNLIAADHLHFFSIMNFFTIRLAATLSPGSHTIVISNIQTPMAAPASAVNVIVRTIKSNAFAEYATFVMTTITSGSFDVGSVGLSISPNMYGCTFASYQFNFTTTKLAEHGTKIVITFPTAYTFTANTECGTIEGLTAYDPAVGITCTAVTRTVTIEGYDDIDLMQPIVVNVLAVSNPGASIDGDTFTIQILDSLGGVVESNTITATATTLTGPAYSPIDLDVTSATLTPRNPLVPSHFDFIMNPTISLPKKAVMIVDFPAAFGVLFSSTATDVECYAEGGLTVLTQCSVSGTQLTIEFGEHTNPSLPIRIYFFGLITYPTALTTLTGFAVTLNYLGLPIATAVTFPTITSSNNMPILDDISMDYYPRNEGEIANYLFTFTPSTTTLTSSMYFLIRFPFEYDPRLYKYNISAESAQLEGALAVTVLHRTLLISGFYPATVTEPITIRIFGIVNPNKVDITKTGAFGFALMLGDEALEGNFNIPGIVPLLAPDSIQFISLKSTLTKARYLDDFTFVFLTKQNILDTELGGQLFMDFPPNYLIDSYDGECNINQEFSFFVNCYIDNNRIFINSSNPTWDPNVDGSLTFEVMGIRNPDIAGDTLNFIIYNYDSVGKKILGRTYSNLNPASLHYEYDGLQIIVNNDEPIDLEVGTYSDEIVIQMPGPSLQTLTLTPNVLDSDILITPFPLKIELGATEVKFRVAAPRTILLKSYYITWAKTGDAFIPSYAPLKRTEIRMRSGFVKRQVLFEEIGFIPLGGTSFPLYVFTNNPPYDELNVTLSILYGNTDAILNTTTLTYGRGEFQKSFTIEILSTHSLSTVDIQFAIAGTDGPSYTLPVDQLTIPINPSDFTPPSITYGEVIDYTRSTATIRISASTLSFIYFVVADLHVPEPQFIDVQNKTSDNATLKYSNPQFGEAYIKTASLTVDIPIKGLTPGKEYDFYGYVMNMNGVVGSTYKRLSFTTNKPQAVAEFVMAIRQNTLANEQKLEIFSKIAAMLSIERSRLMEKTSDCVQTQDSIFYNTPNTTFLHVYVLPDPTSENDLNTPLKLVQNLNERRDEIQAFVPRLAEGDLLQIQELQNDVPLQDDVPRFKSRATFAYATTDALFFTVSVTKCGYVHAIAIPVPGSRNDTPTELTFYQSELPSQQFATSYQIYSGLDLNNQPVNYSKTRINDYSKDYVINISNLEDKLIYDVYITTEDDWPAYNNLLHNAAVARIDMKTLKKRKPLNIFSINYKSGSYQYPCLALILSILVIIIFI